MSVTMKKAATTKTVAIPVKTSLVLASCRTTSSLSLGRHAHNLHRTKRMGDLVAVELAPWDDVLGQRGQILDIGVLQFSWPGPFGPELLSTRTQVFSRRARSAAVAMQERSSAAISSCLAQCSSSVHPMFNCDCLHLKNLTRVDLYPFFVAFREASWARW